MLLFFVDYINLKRREEGFTVHALYLVVTDRSGRLRRRLRPARA